MYSILYYIRKDDYYYLDMRTGRNRCIVIKRCHCNYLRATNYTELLVFITIDILTSTECRLL